MFYIHTKCPFTPSYDLLPVAPTHAIPLTDTTAIFPLALSYPSFESQEIIKAVMKVVIVFSNKFKSNNNRNNSINYMSSKLTMSSNYAKNFIYIILFNLHLKVVR